MKVGKAQGMKVGKAQGMKIKQQQIAKKQLEMGFSIEEVKIATDLKEEEIRKL